MQICKIILASQSKQRFNIFKSLAIPFDVVPADIDEQSIKSDDLQKRAEKIARAKAEFVSEKYPNAIIIAADTYVILNGQVLEKPKNAAEAKEMLRKQSAQTMTEVTGFAYIDNQNKINYSTVVATKVKFRKLSKREIDNYVNNEPVLTWSAAFCPAYDSGAALIEWIEGSLTGFTHGLPMEEVVKMLKKSEIL